MLSRYIPSRLVVVIAALIFGAALGASVLAIFVDPSRWVSPDQRNDWLGFWGSLLGGILGGLATVGAGYLAWSAAQEEVRFLRAESRREKDAEFSIAIVFCIQIERRCDAILKEAAGLLYFQTTDQRISEDEATKIAREAQAANQREKGVVIAADVEQIVYRLPVHAWVRMKKLYRADERINAVVMLMSRQATALDHDDIIARALLRKDEQLYVNVPVASAQDIKQRIEEIRRDAIELKIDLESAREML